MYQYITLDLSPIYFGVGHISFKINHSLRAKNFSAKIKYHNFRWKKIHLLQSGLD